MMNFLKMTIARTLIIASALISYHGVAEGHGSLVTPRSRNSFDFPFTNVSGISPCINVTGAPCLNGQAAYWYSQGCFIGCDECDHVSGRRQTDLCKVGFIATNNDPEGRTLNQKVPAGTPNDIYRHNPWRFPGKAPVGDPCGLAGGTPWGANASEEGKFVNNSIAHHGSRGSQLPELPTGVMWKAGGEAEVAWNVKFNHGGGYQYRLCPASEPLTEECFQKTPLEFVRDKKAVIRKDGTRVPVNGTYIDIGTVPQGSTWSKITLPPNGFGPRCICSPDVNYKPLNFDCGCKMGEQVDSCSTPGNCSQGACLPCPETPGSDCSRCDNVAGAPPRFPLPCEGCENGAMLDVVVVPEVNPGKYVLGWRWDCESTSQIWSNCADIEIQ